MVDKEPSTMLMGVNIDVVDPMGVEAARPPDKALDRIRLGEQKLCQI